MHHDKIGLKLKLDVLFQGKGRPQYANGGWGDSRDQQLCKHFAGQAELPGGSKPMRNHVMQNVALLPGIGVLEPGRIPDPTPKASSKAITGVAHNTEPASPKATDRVVSGLLVTSPN